MFVRLFVRCVVRKMGMSSIFQEVRKVRQRADLSSFSVLVIILLSDLLMADDICKSV